MVVRRKATKIWAFCLRCRQMNNTCIIHVFKRNGVLPIAAVVGSMDAVVLRCIHAVAAWPVAVSQGWSKHPAVVGRDRFPVTEFKIKQGKR